MEETTSLVFEPAAASNLDEFLALYRRAFPPEERRDWESAADVAAFARAHRAEFSASVIRTGQGEFAGLMTVWNLGEACYVEHLVIDEHLRGGGIGARAIGAVCAAARKPVILEVEPPGSGEMALRRIGFYIRNGFVPHYGVDYRQPPYSPGKPEVPLVLMSRGYGAGERPSDRLIARLKKVVYGVAE